MRRFCVLYFLIAVTSFVLAQKTRELKHTVQQPQHRNPSTLNHAIQRELSLAHKRAPAYSIATSTVELEFASAQTGFALTQIRSLLSPPHEFLLPWTSNFSVPVLWEIETVGQEGLQTYYDSLSPATRSVSSSATQLQLIWELTENSMLVNCSVSVSNDHLVFDMEVTVPDDALYCVYTVFYPNIYDIGSLTPQNDTLVYPEDYGLLWNDPGNTGLVLPYSYYPSTYTSFQYMSYHHNNQSGLYFATHDPKAYSKGIYYYSTTAVTTTSENPRSWMSILNFPGNTCSKEISMEKLDKKYKLPYETVLTSFVGDWWDGAEVYRKWVLAEADWTAAGPISKRTDFPQWYLTNGLWMNSNWLPGTLNCTLGDPEIVEAFAVNASKKLNIPFAIHWYCWEFYPFDTNYPDYLPAKNGFKEAIANLRPLGIHVLPYVNGRLYDINAPSYNEKSAHLWTAKMSAPRMNIRSPYQPVEIYGSGQFNSAMCPATTFWQETMAEVVTKVAVSHDTAGLYVDQIGAAGPYLCADASHGHPVLGGDYWVSGYKKLLNRMNTNNTPNRIIITEENAEPYMGYLHGYLTLNAYGDCNMLPAWMAIYGGYQMSVGRMFYSDDLDDLGAGFAFKIGQGFIFGQQMGWFALSGVDGIGQILADEQYQPVLSYTANLSNFRNLANSFLVYGRLMKGVETSSTEGRNISINGCPGVPLIQSSVWSTLTSTSAHPSLGFLFTNPGFRNDNITAFIDLTRYYVDDQKYTIKRMFLNGTTTIAHFLYPNYQLNFQLSPLDTAVFTVEKAST